MTNKEYRGRIAPSPTGFLHIGHAMTFWCAQERARAVGGKLVLRIEDLDRDRCRSEFSGAIIDDLRWCELNWDEGPDVGGPFAPYLQSQRRSRYLEAWGKLQAGGFIYPCKCSRKDVEEASLAPHDENVSLGERRQGAAVSLRAVGSLEPEARPPFLRSAAGKPPLLKANRAIGAHENFAEEPIYPGTCRPGPSAVEAAVSAAAGKSLQATRLPPQGRGKIMPAARAEAPIGTHWRFRVPEGERIAFVDERVGKQSAVAGRDFGDFIVWRRDDVPAYQLAVVVDDAAMQISEVVRGEDLLVSTFRQLLLYRALDLMPPKFFHAQLMVDESGKRLAKRHASLSLRALRESGITPQELRARYEDKS